MNELLQSIKADLLSRRMLPLLAVAGVALLGALAYAAVGGASSAKPPVTPPSAPASPGGVPVSIAPASTTAAAAETPAGVQYQTQGSTRDPFVLPGGSPASSAASPSLAGSSPGSGKSSSSSGGNGSSPGASGGSAPSASTPSHAAPSPAPLQPPSPAPGGPRVSPPPALKPEELPFYNVSALFGLAPAKPGEPATLTPYEDMKRFEPLPMAKAALVVFVGVISKKGTDRALFALIAPPILRGAGSCYPSDTHCQAIELEAGKSEELEFVKPSGETVDFELKIVKISKRSAPAGAASAKALHVSRAGKRALSAAGFDAAW